MRDYLQRLAIEAGVDLPLNECWVLVQLRRGCNDIPALCERSGAPAEAIESTLATLAGKGLITNPPAQLTDGGTVIADRLLATVRDRLDKLLDGWSPEQYPDLVHLLSEMAAEVIPARESLPA
jgi:hypothetical protein